MRLAGKNALVTGSSHGIGAEIAQHFAREGAKVVVCHRSSPLHAETTSRKILQSGGEAMVIHCDVSDPDSVASMIEQIRGALGGLDIVVNCAGLSDSRIWNAGVHEIDLEMWNRVFAVDTFGTFLCIQGALRIMKHGSIVNVASTPALAGDKDGLVYACAKGAVISMTRMLSKSLAPRVRVNCMVFGSIGTEWVNWLDPLRRRAYRAAIPMGRFGRPAEAAALALYLASDESSFMTGQVIVLDGGEVLH